MVHDQYVKSPYDGKVVRVFVYIYPHKMVQFTNDYVYVMCRNKIHFLIIKNNT